MKRYSVKYQYKQVVDKVDMNPTAKKPKISKTNIKKIMKKKLTDVLRRTIQRYEKCFLK